MNGSLRNWQGFFDQGFKLSQFISLHDLSIDPPTPVRANSTLIRNVHRHCKPGGWIECQELDVSVDCDDNSIPEDSYMKKWAANQEESISKIGLSLRMSGEFLKSRMETAGFVNVTTKEFKCPIGTWPADRKLREIGAFQLVAMLDGLQGLTIKLWTAFIGWQEQEIEVFLAKLRAEWRNSKIHSYWPM